MSTLKNAEFTTKMRKTHTIYMPQMLHYHNELLCAAFAYGGYRLAVVPEQEKFCKETLSMIGKDYCTCAIGIIGNLLTFVKENDALRDKIAFLEPQAGGACRAGNYYNLIIECLRKCGYEQIPVLSLNYHGLEKHRGFQINLRMLQGAVAAVCYGDLLMTLTQQIRPYEVNVGETEALRQKWIATLKEEIAQGRKLTGRKTIYREIVETFRNIQTTSGKKTRVGIVGEIYIKFSPVGNCHLEEFLSQNDCEYRQGGFINYCIYVVYSEMKCMELQHKSKGELWMYQKVIDYLCGVQKQINELLQSEGFLHDANFYDLLELKGAVMSDYYNIGDGWLMTAEIMDLIKQGYDKILIVHPFGCLVSHVGGRGIIKKVKELYPKVKISSVEYDYDQSKTLRESRILMAIN